MSRKFLRFAFWQSLLFTGYFFGESLREFSILPVWQRI